MSEDEQITTSWQRDPRLRYLAPVVILLGLLLLILIVAASCGGGGSDDGLKPFRPTRTRGEATVDGQLLALSFTELNAEPAAYQNQRIRVTGNYMILAPPDCRLYTGPLFAWGLIAEELQLNALGFEELVRYLPEGLEMTVEGVWRLYDGPLGCGKGPADGVAWYLQVERIIAPNPLPLISRTVMPTLPGASGTIVATQPGIVVTPLETRTLETAVPDQPGIGITPLATNTPPFPGTPPGPLTLTPTPTGTVSGLMTTTPIPGQTVPPTLLPGQTGTPAPGGTATPTFTPSATVPGLTTQTPAATSPGYPNPNTPVPTSDPYG
ncbi:MAG: hypothetical protein R6X34_02300 [Chloroflexota bacterium]